MSGKPIATEAPYGYMKAPDNKVFWIIDEEAAEVVRLIFRLFLDGKNRNQIAVYLMQEQIPTPTFYMKDRGRGTCKNKTLNEDDRYKWNKATLTHILTRQEYCGDVVNFKTTKQFLHHPLSGRSGQHELRNLRFGYDRLRWPGTRAGAGRNACRRGNRARAGGRKRRHGRPADYPADRGPGGRRRVLLHQIHQGHHRTIVSAAFAQSFAPSVQL